MVPSLPFFAFVVGGAFALPLAGGGTALPLAGGGGAAFPLPGLILPLASAVLLSFALLSGGCRAEATYWCPWYPRGRNRGCQRSGHEDGRRRRGLPPHPAPTWLKSRSSTSDPGSGVIETPTPRTHLFVSTLSAVRRFEGL